MAAPSAAPPTEAQTAEQDELEALEVERESLLDVVMAKAKAMGIQEKVQRVLIALTYAKASDSGQDVADEMRASITRLESEDEKQGRVTGLSLLMPGVCLALLEGPQRLIIGMLRSFQQPDSTMRRVTGSMHMFLSVQDAPARTFHEYHSATVKMDAAAPSVPDTDQAVKIVPEMSVNLLKFGRDMDGPEAVENIKSRMGEDFPRLQDVLGLTQSSDMLTLDDFFDLYYAPAKCFGAPLDAQVVWPLPPALNF